MIEAHVLQYILAGRIIIMIIMTHEKVRRDADVSLLVMSVSFFFHPTFYRLSTQFHLFVTSGAVCPTVNDSFIL